MLHKFKICVIGPTYPFRGGISHYTTLLYRFLKKRRHETTFISFKRQYPQWLFPGATDSDPSSKPIYEDGVLYTLDSLNPVSWVKTARTIRTITPQIVIIPWWSTFWTVPFLTIITLIKKWTNAKILFICHNVKEHETNRLNHFFSGAVLRKGDLHLIHSREEYLELIKMKPDATVIHGFHPTYEDLRVNEISREQARKKLQLSGKVLLFFGFLRPYKGLEYLLEAMPLIIKQLGDELTLLVVGEGWKGEEEYKKKIKVLGIGSHIKRINRYIRNEEIGLFFSASDLVVTPYISATGSGILQIAFGHGIPVVASHVGGLADDVNDGKTGYLVPPADHIHLADAIVKYFVENKAPEFTQNIKNTKDRFSWHRMVELIEEGVRTVL